MKTHLFYLLLVILLSGACLDIKLRDCESYIPQKYHLGQMEAEMITSSPTLQIGDTIHLSLKVPKKIKDTLDQEIDIDRGIRVFVKITDTENQSDTSNNDFFGTDTTIFYVFDQYFDTKNIKGSPVDAYRFQCELNNDFWELETEYITKKAGNYWANISFQFIDTSDADLEEGVCMEGDPETFNARIIWKENENNRIDVLFNDEKENYPDYYGFIVEE